MPNFYFDVGGASFVRFRAPAAAYPAGLQAKLGVLATPPDNARQLIGKPSDYGCVRVRLGMANGKQYYRLCDPDAFSSSFNVVGDDLFGSKVVSYGPARRRVFY